MANAMRSKLLQAQSKRLFKKKKRETWQNYVSNVNTRTSMKKVWNMIRKITGKNVPHNMHHLKSSSGELITDT